MDKKKLLLSLMLLIFSIFIFNTKYDISILEVIEETRTDALNSFFKTFTHFGSYRFLIPFSVLIFFFFKDKLPLSLGILLASIFNTIIKYIVSRPRPNLAPLVKYTSFSYPSGHTMVNAVFAYFLYRYLFKADKRAIIPLILYSLLMAYSRLYLGVHYPSDIIGGYSAALLFIAFFDYVYSKNTKTKKSF
ncbi:MAG: phosphatase PAP2 family protein [Clostridia bacterium]